MRPSFCRQAFPDIRTLRPPNVPTSKMGLFTGAIDAIPNDRNNSSHMNVSGTTRTLQICWDKVQRSMPRLLLSPNMYSLTLSVLTAIFPGGSGLAGTWMTPFWIILKLRMMEVEVTTAAIRCAKLQSNRHHQQTNTQFFYRSEALPVARQCNCYHVKPYNAYRVSVFSPHSPHIIPSLFYSRLETDLLHTA